MPPTPASNRLREWLGDETCALIADDFTATTHDVVYGGSVSVACIGPFGVGTSRQLDVNDTTRLRQSLLDDTTWRWDRITRHRAIPEVLIDLVHGDAHVVLVVDRRGAKLGVLRDDEILARDLATDSDGARVLSSLIDANAARSGGNTQS